MTQDTSAGETQRAAINLRWGEEVSQKRHREGEVGQREKVRTFQARARPVHRPGGMES